MHQRPSSFVGMRALLLIGNLFASSSSHRGLNTSLACSAGAFQCRDGVYVAPLHSILYGFVLLALGDCGERGMKAWVGLSSQAECLREEFTEQQC